MIKAVLFDMDGLMIDSEPVQSRAFEAIIREYGGEPELFETGLVHKAGLSGEKNWEWMKAKYGIAEDTTVLRMKRRAAYDTLLHEVEAMAGLEELLTLLNQNNIPAVVVTNSIRTHAEPILSRIGAMQFFDFLVCGDEVKNRKPDPEIYHKASQRLETHPTECLVLEDTETGITGAKSIGMKAIAVPSQFTKHHNFTEADRVVHSLHDISYAVLSSL